MNIPKPSRLVLSLAVAAMVAAISAMPARADDQAAFERSQAFQQRNWENYLDEMPVLDPNHPARALADVLSFSTVDGQLTLRTSLPSTPMGPPMRVKLDASPNWSLLGIVDGATGKDPVVPATFTLNRNRFDPDQREMLLVQQNKGNFLIITHQTMTAAGQRLLSLQVQFANANQPGACHVMIMDQTHAGGMRTPPLNWTSDSFSAFVREHPVEAELNLRPLFHELGQDAALAPDPMLAFQVFSDQWTPTAAMTTQVNTLVTKLGGGDFHSRTHAQSQLTALGQDAAVVLLHLDRSKLGPEQNARIDKILSPYCPVPAKQAATLRTDPAFLLDCLYSDDLPIRKIALAQLESVTKLTLNFDPPAAPPTRTATIPPILNQLIAAKFIVPKP
ncbi:MAG TPA: hypothetical protein VHY37_13090 [Tepidisphaeraceae bacterium]|jgi:hypothetical protein|nr:hypothetical protein [Tepidisphaeraceae bacterium]